MPLPPSSAADYLDVDPLTFTLSAQDGSQFDPSRPIVIRSRVVSVQGTVTAPGCTLFIVADELICGSITNPTDATIDVSGAPPDNAAPSAAHGLLAPWGYNPAARAHDGVAEGNAGQNWSETGLPAPSNGQNAGSLVLVCRQIKGSLTLIANGGDGGDGLAGGNGADGWSDALPVLAKGPPGGNAGSGGPSGDAGAGGTILVDTVVSTAESLATIETSVSAGKPGTPGLPGKPGHGGLGGPPAGPPHIPGHGIPIEP